MWMTKERSVALVGGLYPAMGAVDMMTVMMTDGKQRRQNTSINAALKKQISFGSGYLLVLLTAQLHIPLKNTVLVRHFFF